MQIEKTSYGYAVVVFVALFGSAANAATIYKSERTTEGGRAGGTTSEVIESTIDGPKAKLVFVETQNPMLAGGGYMLVAGPGSTYIVSPARHAYMRIDKAELGAMTNAAAGATTQSEQSETIEDFDMKQLVDEAGPTLLGMPTHHYKFELKYTVAKPVPQNDLKTLDKHDRTYEIWATRSIELPKDAQIGVVLGSAPSKYPQVAEAEQRIASVGFPLKKISEIKESSNLTGAMGTMGILTHMTGHSGGSAHDITITEVITDLHESKVPADTFDLPKGYTEMTMMGPSAGMPNLNQMPGGMPPGMHMPPGMQMPQGQGQDAQAPQGMPDLNQIPSTPDPKPQ